ASSDVLEISAGEERTVTPSGLNESDDELADHSVNLVVLGEVDGKLDEQLARHHSPHRKRNATGDGQISETPNVSVERQGNPTIFVDQQKVTQSGLMKSMSDISCNRRTRSCSVDREEEEERPNSRESRKL